MLLDVLFFFQFFSQYWQNVPRPKNLLYGCYISILTRFGISHPQHPHCRKLKCILQQKNYSQFTSLQNHFLICLDLIVNNSFFLILLHLAYQKLAHSLHLNYILDLAHNLQLVNDMRVTLN